jgi:2-polyprenyl-3-methyl-5-hydroxy-6-metoxy-1,4-benzoquinol methylase
VPADTDKVREDFDRIARLTAGDGDHGGPYDDFLLEQVPRSCRRVLEVGCGAGAFSRALARRGHSVTAVDLSPEMLRVARERTAASEDVAYSCGDFMRDEPDGAPFDCVVSIATLHHLDVAAAVPRMAALVRPGGVLVVHDVRADAGVWDRLRSLAALGARVWAGRAHQRAEVREAWHHHGRDERYATMADVERWSRDLLPGSRAVRHLQWRYTVVWTNHQNRARERSARS